MNEWYFTGNIVYKSNGYKRHYLRNDDHTICHLEVNGNWKFGDEHPPVPIDYYCEKCFPTQGRVKDKGLTPIRNKFHIVHGQVVRDSH